MDKIKNLFSAIGTTWNLLSKNTANDYVKAGKGNSITKDFIGILDIPFQKYQKKNKCSL